MPESSREELTSLPRSTRSFAPLAAALAAILVYAVTLRGTYVYDDVKVVHTDPRVLHPDQWGKLWTQPFFAVSVDKLYRPLVSMSFAIENYLHGDRPWIFHLVNILLHAGVAAMIAALGIRLAGPVAGWIAGILFAVHPVHVEAVAGLVGRAESACALAILGGIYLFLRPGQIGWRRGLAIWLCFVVALLSKEQGILFPLLLAAALPVRYRQWPQQRERKEMQYTGIALLYTLVAYFLWREHVASFAWDPNRLDWYVNPMIRSTGLDRVLMPFALLGRYAALLVFPLHLSIDYGGWIIGWRASAHDPYVYLGLAALIAGLIVAWVSWRRRNWGMLFLMLALAITYGMVGNVVALIGTIFAERLMYLPSAFLLLALGIALSRVPPRIVAPIVLVLAIAGGIRSYTYARQWNNPEELFRNVIRLHPQSERGYLLLCNVYQARGDWKDALFVAKQACDAVPERWEPYVMCIQCDLALHDFDAADVAVDEGLARASRDAKLIFIQWKDIISRKRAKFRN